MIECSADCAYIIMLICLVCSAGYAYCDLRQFRAKVFHWLLVVYDRILKRQVKKQQEEMEKTHYKSLYLNDDEEGAYILLENTTSNTPKKVYLKAIRAKPLMGFLAGSNYYTTDESEKFVEITLKKRF